jgi:hypothetical protein
MCGGRPDLDHQEIIELRRRLSIAGYKSLADVGFDGPWVTPYQISSKSPDGPVLVALHWLDEHTVKDQRTILAKLGYLPDIRFNKVIDIALKKSGLSRSDIYVTQTFHLIPLGRSESIGSAAIRKSFDEVTQYELRGRKVIALGDVAARECQRQNIKHLAVCHPSRRGHTHEQNAIEIADAIGALGFRGGCGKARGQDGGKFA